MSDLRELFGTDHISKRQPVVPTAFEPEPEPPNRVSIKEQRQAILKNRSMKASAKIQALRALRGH